MQFFQTLQTLLVKPYALAAVTAKAFIAVAISAAAIVVISWGGATQVAFAETGERFGTSITNLDKAFSKQVMPLGGALKDLHFVDLNGDQLEDVIGIYAKPVPNEASKTVPVLQSLHIPFTKKKITLRYHVRVFLQTPDHRFQQKVDMALPDALGAIDIGQFAAGAGLVMLQEMKVYLWLWKNNRFVKADSQPLQGWPLLSSIDSLPREYPLLTNLNADLYDELIIPTGGHASIFSVSKQGKLERKAVIQHEVSGDRRYSASRNRWESFFTVPLYFPLNLDGKGWKDVAWYHQGKLDVTLLNKKGNIVDGTPTRFQFSRHLHLIKAQDVNQNGMTDLVFTRVNVSSSIFSAKGEVYVHQARKNTHSKHRIDYVAKPDVVYERDGLVFPLFSHSAPAKIVDLVMLNVNVGFSNVIRSILSRSISVQASWYPATKGGHYANEPAATRHYTVGISLGRDSHQPIVAFADLNADGQGDLILSQGKNRLLIHWGQKDVLWPSMADARVSVRVPTRSQRLHIRNLDGDGRDDLIFAYSEQDNKHFKDINQQITVLLSRVPLK